MKGKLSTILLLSLAMLCVNNKAVAQLLSDLRLGVMAGSSLYYGDLPRTANAGAALSLSKENIFKTFSFRAQLSYGELKSKVLNDYGQVFVKFNSQFVEAALLPEYNFFNLEQRRITPYITTGIALAGYFNSSGYYQGNATQIGKYTFDIPFGAGLKIALNEGVHIRVEYLQRITFSNLIDGIDQSKGYDYWGQAMIGINFRLPSTLPYRKGWRGRLE